MMRTPSRSASIVYFGERDLTLPSFDESIATSFAAKGPALLRIGLLQSDARTLGGTHHLVARDLQQSPVHRVGDGLRLHGAVDDDALEIGGAHGLDPDRAFDGGLEQLLRTVLTQQAPKATDLGGRFQDRSATAGLLN